MSDILTTAKSWTVCEGLRVEPLGWARKNEKDEVYISFTIKGRFDCGYFHIWVDAGATRDLLRQYNVQRGSHRPFDEVFSNEVCEKIDRVIDDFWHKVKDAEGELGKWLRGERE